MNDDEFLITESPAQPEGVRIVVYHLPTTAHIVCFIANNCPRELKDKILCRVKKDIKAAVVAKELIK